MHDIAFTDAAGEVFIHNGDGSQRGNAEFFEVQLAFTQREHLRLRIFHRAARGRDIHAALQRPVAFRAQQRLIFLRTRAVRRWARGIAWKNRHGKAVRQRIIYQNAPGIAHGIVVLEIEVEAVVQGVIETVYRVADTDHRPRHVVVRESPPIRHLPVEQRVAVSGGVRLLQLCPQAGRLHPAEKIDEVVVHADVVHRERNARICLFQRDCGVVCFKCILNGIQRRGGVCPEKGDGTLNHGQQLPRCSQHGNGQRHAQRRGRQRRTQDAQAGPRRTRRTTLWQRRVCLAQAHLHNFRHRARIQQGAHFLFFISISCHTSFSFLK